MLRAKTIPAYLVVFLTGLVLPGTAWAASEQDALQLGPTSGSKAPQVNSGGIFLQMALALAITVGVIWLVYRGLKIWNKKTSKGVNQSPAVQVLSRTEVDRDMTVYVLQLGDTVSVVGRTAQGQTLLRELSREEAEFDGLYKSVNPARESIHDLWGEIRSKFQKRSSEPQPIMLDELLGEKPVAVDDLLESGEEK